MFFFLYQISHLWAKKDFLFSCVKSIAITEGSEEKREHVQVGGRETAIPVSLTLPDGCHLP